VSNRLKKGLAITLMVLIGFATARLYYRLTDDFRLSNITYELPFEAPWQTPALSNDERDRLVVILDQKFTYLGKGAQCYAFGSADGQYVLKFFKFKHLKPSLIVDLIPPIPPLHSYKQQCVERKKRKLIGVFNGYDLAFRENRDSAALLYIHLTGTDNLNMKAHVIDKIGLEREIDLDPVVFLIQQKGETLRNRIKRLMEDNRLQEVNQSISNVVSMYISEYRKGLFDHDHGVMHNTGFIADRPFHLDVGKLNRDDRMKDPFFYKRDLEQVIWKIDNYFKQHHSSIHPEMTMFLSSLFEKWTGDPIDLQAVDPKKFKKFR
jgi:hypothetical protein